MNNLKLDELEKRVRAERDELDKLVALYDANEDALVQNKLKYLESEIEYLSRRVKLLNEFTLKKPGVEEERVSFLNKEVALGTAVLGNKTADVKDETAVKEDIIKNGAEAVKETADKAVEEVTASEEVIKDSATAETVVKDSATAETVIKDSATAETVIEDSATAETVIEDSATIETVIEDSATIEAAVNTVSKDETVSAAGKEAENKDSKNAYESDELPDVVTAIEDPEYNHSEKTVDTEHNGPVKVWVREGSVSVKETKPQDASDKVDAVKSILDEVSGNKVETPDKIKEESAPKAPVIETSKAAEEDIEKSAQTPVAKTVENTVKAEDYEVEEPFEIKKIPEKVIKSEKKKKASLENKIGLWVMPIMAATLIFISVILLASALPEQIGNAIKQVTMVIAGFSFAGIGIFLKRKKKGGAFGQVLMAIGAGELFVSLVVIRFVFASINDLWLFILIFIWSAALVVLKRFSSILFQIIGEIGVATAVIFGTCYSLSMGNHVGLYVVAAFYTFGAIVYYFLFKFRGEMPNVIIYHAFNIVKLVTLSIGILLATKNPFVAIGIIGLFASASGFLGAVDVIFAFRSESVLDKIMGPLCVFFYSIQIFFTSIFSMMYIELFAKGCDETAFSDGLLSVYRAIGDSRWLMITISCIFILILMLFVEYVWTESDVKYYMESLFAFTLIVSLILSHPTFKFGFIVMMILMTVLGYLRKNHVLKITALLFYIGYAFLPDETVFRIAVGLVMAAVWIILLYRSKKQYFFAYKVSVYFSLILYSITVSFSSLGESSIYGISWVVVIAFVALLDIVAMFSNLSKNTEKESDFAFIPELLNIIITGGALILSMSIKCQDGEIGFIPLLIAFVLIIISLFRGYLQDRIICRINSVLALAVGTVTLSAFEYSAFWFASISIAVALALMYIKKEKYTFVEKFVYFLLTLVYVGDCVYYFRESLDFSQICIISVWLIAATVITYIFKFTPLAKDGERVKDDFEWVTFVTHAAIVLTSMAVVSIADTEDSMIYVPFAIMSIITLVWLIHGFIVGKNKEKIAVLAVLFLAMLNCFELKIPYTVFEIAIAALYLVFLYIKKESYKVVYKGIIYFQLLVNCVIVPILFETSFEDVKYVGVQGVILIALMFISLLFKFTGLSKNPKDNTVDTSYITFVSDAITLVYSMILIVLLMESGNYVPTAVLAIMICIWLIHGFAAQRYLYKIAFIVSMFTVSCISWAFVPTLYTVITTTLTIIFFIFLYTNENAYSIWYKLPVYALALLNAVICPALYYETLGKIEGLGVVRIMLVALLIINVLFKYSILSKNPDTEEEDFHFATFVSFGLIDIFALVLTVYYNKTDLANFIPSAIFFIVLMIWVIDGFLKERLTEKIASLAAAFFAVFFATFFIPGLYSIMVVIFTAVYLFFLYRAEESYSFTFKWIIYTFAMLNSFVCPIICREFLKQNQVFVTLNVILLATFLVNTAFRFTPIAKNPESEEKDMDLITFTVCQILVLLGLIFTAILKAPADILTGTLTLILVPMGSAWFWTEEDDKAWCIAGRYFAVTEYLFVPFFLCYAMSAPAYVSSIVGIVLAVGCIVLGFVTKMKGVRIYGLLVSMIMIFKLALVDFEKSSLLAYALSFFIAGVACLIISMLYYFVNAAMAEKE